MSNAVIRLDWEKAGQLVGRADRILVVGHARPDADDLGSICAIGAMLIARGKSVVMAVEGGSPEELRYIPGAAVVQDSATGVATDLIISCDSSDRANLGAINDQIAALDVPVLVIDHHVTNALFGDTHLVDSTAVSTTEILYRWFHYLAWPIAQAVAECLLCGILTDTQLFKVGPVTSQTFVRVSELIGDGADFAAMRNQVSKSQSLSILRLTGLARSRAQIKDGVAWAWLEVADFAAERIPAKRNVGVADDMLGVRGAVIGVEFAATDEGNVRLSLRCVEGYDVGGIALALGGGGHAKAAGGTLQSISLGDAMDKVLPLLMTEARRALR